MTGFLVVLITLAILTIVVAMNGIKQVAQGTAAIVERLGEFRIELRPGLNFIVPFLDKVRIVRNVNVKSDVRHDRIDLREQIMDIPAQEIISKDNIRVQVDTIVFYQIVEPYKAVYEISSPVEAIKQLSQTTIRNILGEMDLDASLTARESINGRLRSILDEATDKWGIKVLRVEIQEIKPPVELKDAMQKQMIAERKKREMITLAEAEKRKNILDAEGFKQKAILEAEGRNRAVVLDAEAVKQQKVLEAEGESKSIQMVQEATAKGLEAVQEVLAKTGGSNGVILIEALKTQQSVAESLASGTNAKFFLPNEIAGLFGAVGGLSEILKMSKSLDDK